MGRKPDQSLECKRSGAGDLTLYHIVEFMQTTWNGDHLASGDAIRVWQSDRISASCSFTAATACHSASPRRMRSPIRSPRYFAQHLHHTQ
jgi:hypothetical protein